MVASRKLRPYFHAHPIEVLTNYPLRQVLQMSKALSRLFKWATELGWFEMNFRPQTAIKGQALADFIAKFTYSNTAEVTRMANNTEVAKVIGEREKENYVSTEGTLNSGPFMWTVPPMTLGPELA